jgi:hypothetical protein
VKIVNVTNLAQLTDVNVIVSAKLVVAGAVMDHETSKII